MSDTDKIDKPTKSNVVNDDTLMTSLKQDFYDPQVGLQSLDKLYKKLKTKYPS